MSAVSGALAPEACDEREPKWKRTSKCSEGGKRKIFYEMENETGKEHQSIWWLERVLL